MAGEDLIDFNLMKSVEKFIREHADLAGYMSAGQFLSEDTDFSSVGKNFWAQLLWVDFGSGPFTTNTLHLRFFSRSIDRFGRAREIAVGDFKKALSTSDGIPFMDFITDPDDVTTIQNIGRDLSMAIRFAGRSPLLDAESMGESGGMKGVSLVTLTYNVYAPRCSEIL